MKPLTRWIIAIVLALVLLGLGVAVYFAGFFLGGMSTDACSNLPGSSFAYLEYFWPVVLLASALAAPVLIVRKFRPNSMAACSIASHTRERCSKSLPEPMCMWSPVMLSP